MTPSGNLSDHELFLALKCQNAEAWRFVWEKVVQAECNVRSNAEMIGKWGVSPEEVMSVLYAEMIGHDKISGYHDDGGNLVGWLKKYVRGYIYRSNPENPHIELSDSVPETAVVSEGDVSETREDLEIVQRCFPRRKDPCGCAENRSEGLQGLRIADGGRDFGYAERYWRECICRLYGTLGRHGAG